MKKKKINIGGFIFEYNSKVVTIKDAWKTSDKKYIELLLKYFREQTSYSSKRSVSSWVREWKTHSLLYKLGLFKTHTIDCDLEEQEALHRRIVYFFLGGF